jgi:hypothetical protein
LRFESCYAVDGYANDEAQNEDGNSLPHYIQTLVKYSLCPSDGKCNEQCTSGGDYVTGVRSFLEAYQQAQEAKCEVAAASCDCDNYYGDDDAVCKTTCYQNAGLDYCEEEVDANGNVFDLAEYMECKEAEFGNNAYYDSTFYIGPVCAESGDAIYLDVFKDASCSIKASSDVYESYNNGVSLPYSQQSVVDDVCMSCTEDDGNNNGYYQQQASESCTMLYQQASKCEDRMNGMSYTNEKSCTYINKILPALDNVHKKSGGSGASTAFAWIFFFTTIAASGAVLYLLSVLQRSNVNLVDKTGHYS